MKTSGSDITREIMSPGEKTLNIINRIILSICGLCALYPFIYVLSASISSGAAVDAGKVVLFPQGINFEAYQKVLKDNFFWTAYGNTFFYTIFGTAFSMIVSAPAAYTLSKKRFRFRKHINIMISFTMWFQVGFIPSYLNYKSLGAINNRWMIIVSFGIQAFNIILLRNYFESVSESLEEAAKIDGASDFQIFTKVFLPLSKPALTTVWLYYAIGRWNGFFWSAVLLKEKNKIPLQVYLKQKLIDMSIVSENANTVVGQHYSYTTLVYAIIVCSLIPIILVYPYIQRYFTKGIMVGGVKE